MRFATTLILLLLVLAGAALWWSWESVAPRLGWAPAPAADKVPSADDLAAITPASLSRVEFNDVRLERDGKVWNLPGGWPTRTAEVDKLVALLSGLESRFAPVPLGDPSEFGLADDQKPVTVRVSLAAGSAERNLTLTFGEPADGENRFVRPTYLRVNDRPDVLRLAPGLIDQLRKSRDDFLRRQLFPDVARVKLGDAGRPAIGGEPDLPPPAVALIDAKELAVSGPDGAWSLRKTGADLPKSGSVPVATTAEKLAANWELTAPVTDHVDPDKLKGVLAAVPDLWAEAFVQETDLQKTGLDKPERTVSVKSGDRDLKLLIGHVSRVKETRSPVPPPANPFAPPPPPPPPTREEYRYAKLPNNPLVFEVRTDKFSDLFVKPAELRDPKLARFKPGDVRKLEIALPLNTLVLTKDGDDKWRIEQPIAAAADAPRVTELLDKLSELQARGPDMIDTADLKPYGFGDGDKPVLITLTLAEGDTAGPGRTIGLRLGKTDDAKKKLYMQAVGVSRVDAVPDDLMKLVDRPAVAYRSRRIIDAPVRQLASIQVERSSDAFTVQQSDGIWSLAQPVAAKADAGKASSLAADLARLEAAEFVAMNPAADELKKYGLDHPGVRVNLAFTDPGMPAKTLLLGGPREGKSEVYAQLADAPEVFAVRQSVKEAVDQPSLAFRPLQVWQVAGNQVQAIEVERGPEKFTLSRDGAFWKVAGPFVATAFLPAVQPLLDLAAAPRAERFEAHDGDLAKYGLDKPAERLRVTIKSERPDDPAGVKEIQFGKPVTDGQPSRYARMADQPGVFVIGSTAADAVSRPALELLDRKLLAIDPRQVIRLEGTGPAGAWSARRDGDRWIIDSLNPAANGDRTVLDATVNALADLRAQKFAAYSPVDWAKFGLDKPSSTLTVTVAAGDKPVSHSIALGGQPEQSDRQRFARVDNGAAAAVLSGTIATELSRPALDLVDRGIFQFDPKTLTGVIRRTGEQELSLQKSDGQWKIIKPEPAAAADGPALAEMAERLATLRAVRVAALGAKDLKPFGLDAPAATLTLQRTGTPDAAELQLMIGAATDGGRFATAGRDTIFVLPDSKADPLATRLLAEPIKFRDRGLARFNDADRVTVMRGGRTATFARRDGFWKMTAPVEGEAESGEVDELVLAAGRLRADELVADKPADLAPFGLDKPQADLRFFLGDNEVLHLLVGDRDADGRAAAKLAGGDAVSRLDAGLSNRVLGEFRKRALWTNLDAASVDTLIINAGAGGTPLIMNKTDAGWQVADRPDQRVNTDAVNGLLASLAGLRAERFVADQKGDLKLYGLEPPVRVIVVKSRGGQATTLHIGRFEGDSKRAYATVPGGDGAVVVLSDADSARLLTPVGELARR